MHEELEEQDPMVDRASTKVTVVDDRLKQVLRKAGNPRKTRRPSLAMAMGALLNAYRMCCVSEGHWFAERLAQGVVCKSPFKDSRWLRALWVLSNRGSQACAILAILRQCYSKQCIYPHSCCSPSEQCSEGIQLAELMICLLVSVHQFVTPFLLFFFAYSI